MGKSAKLRSAKKEAFLVAYSEIGVVSRAAEAANVDRNMHWRWLRDDPEYPARFVAAHGQACDALETEARRRAIEGWEEPVYQGGQLVGTKRRYSDTMLAMLLNANLPEKYGRNRVEHSGPNGGALETQSTVKIYPSDAVT